MRELLSRKVVITGVAGFVGSNLAVRLLNEGFSVVGIDNLSYGPVEQVPDGVDFHKLDVRDADIYTLFNGAEAVFHLAAKNCISDCQNDPVETSSINVTGTVNVFEAARRAGNCKVIYAESSALYEGINDFPTPEKNINPVSFYSVSKFAGMAFAEAYQRFYGLNMTALRYFCVYGPRQDYRRTIPPVMSAFIINLLKKQRPTIYGTGEKRRDFIYVDDVNDFHVLCLNNQETNGKTFNLGSASNYSVKDIFNVIEDILKTGIEPEYKNDLPGEAEITLADISAAKALGWKAKTDIYNGLKQSIEFIKKEVVS